MHHLMRDRTEDAVGGAGGGAVGGDRRDAGAFEARHRELARAEARRRDDDRLAGESETDFRAIAGPRISAPITGRVRLSLQDVRRSNRSTAASIAARGSGS